MKEQMGEIANEVKPTEAEQPSEKYWALQWGFPTIHLLPSSAD